MAEASTYPCHRSTVHRSAVRGFRPMGVRYLGEPLDQNQRRCLQTHVNDERARYKTMVSQQRRDDREASAREKMWSDETRHVQTAEWPDCLDKCLRSKRLDCLDQLLLTVRKARAIGVTIIGQLRSDIRQLGHWTLMLEWPSRSRPQCRAPARRARARRSHRAVSKAAGGDSGDSDPPEPPTNRRTATIGGTP
jgi:hypothetical protein